MAVYLVAVAQALVYLWATPVYVTVRLRWAEELRVAAAVSPFAPRRARVLGRKRGGRRRGLSKKASPGTASSAARAVWALLRRNQARVRVEGTLCLGDAAATALTCGAVTALGQSLRPALPALRLKLRPDFDGSDPRLELRGEFSARAGRMAAAALRESTIHRRLHHGQNPD